MALVKDAFVGETEKKKKKIPKIKGNTNRAEVAKAVSTNKVNENPYTYNPNYKSSNERQAIKEEAAVLPGDNVAKTAPTETIEDIINRMRREKEVANALAREQAIKSGTTQLQGNLDATQAQLNRQQEGLDPRFGEAKASAVAGTRVSQNRLANLIPFSGQQSGRSLRQAQGIETELQNRQSDLDTQRQQEEADIAFNRQQAIDQYNQGLTQLQQGATLSEIEANTRANELANQGLLDQARIDIETERDTLAQQKQDFINTINRFSQDFAAQILQVQNDGDTSNDWQIPLLESARQDKILGIEQGQQQAAQDTLSLAQGKWNAYIPLNQAEADALGVPVGSTKPRASSGSSGGLSASALSTNARYKLTNGIPLNAQEAQILGLEEGYVQEGSEVSGAEDLYPDSTFTANISQQLQGTDQNTSQEEIRQIIALGLMDQVRQGNITNDLQLGRLLTRYNLTEAEVDAILQAEQAEEQRISTPGVGGLNLP